MGTSSPQRCSTKFPGTLAALALAIICGGCGAERSAVATETLASKKTGSITVALDLRPKPPTDVPFAFENKKFTLTDDGTAGSNTRTFDKLKPGTYAVEMTRAADGPLTGILCSSNLTANDTTDVASRTATIVLEAGESVVCTFVDGWDTGDLVTFTQADWGNATDSTAPSLLAANFNSVYASTFGTLEVGIPGTAGYSIAFTDAQSVIDYLPGSGASGPLTSDQLNPTSSSSGVFGGAVVALRLDVDFSDAMLTGAASDVAFGDLTLCGLTTPSGFNEQTVRQVLSIAETLLGGGSATYTIAEVEPIASLLTASSAAGQPSPSSTRPRPRSCVASSRCTPTALPSRPSRRR